MKCNGCGFQNREDTRYCTQCGSSLFLFCQKCDFGIAEGDIFCGGCGARLPSFSEKAPAFASSKSAPQQIQKQSPQAPPSMESERRNVTVLFADISGFTAMSELMDPEDVTNIMNGCMKLLAHSVAKYEGYVDKFIGDCIMAIFGAPIAHENDPELAVRAALLMKKEIEEYNKTLTVKLEKPLTLHTGINTGMVIAGGVGSQQKMEYTVMGDTVNLASRLESKAGTGQIFISSYTYNLARNHFEFIHHEPITVKGKKKPITVYEVVKARSQKDQGEKSGAAIAPLVGRSHEMKTLNGCLEKLVSGVGQAVFLVSEAGVGKSRIRFETKKQLQKDSLQLIEGNCHSFNSTTSYYIFSELFKNLFNIDSEDLTETIAEKTAQNLPLILGMDAEALNQEAREAIVFIGAILGLKLGDDYDIHLDQMEAQEIKTASFRSIAWFFDQLSRKKPLVLVLEDLHYADNTSVELIAYLCERLKSIPVMLLLLMRPQKDHPSSKLTMIAKKNLEDNCTEIVFNRLKQPECNEMVKSLLKTEKLPDDLLKLIWTRADGNPLYIEEIVQSLLDEEIIEKTEKGEINVIKDLNKISLPSSIHGMIIARIDKLQSSLKDILNTAAVIGPIFQGELIKEVINQGDLEEKINQLLDMGLLFESKSFPEIEYSFRNVLIREAVYSCLLLQKRKELHAVVAGVIERFYENRLEDHYEVLARHFLEAGNTEQASHYLFLSGLKAKNAFANKEAVDYFDRTLKLAEKLDSPPMPLENVFIALSEVRELLAEFDAAIETRRKAMDLISDDLKKADNMRNIGRIYEKQALKKEAMKVYEETSTLLKDHQTSVEMGLLIMNQSWILNRMKKFDEALEKGFLALKILEKHDSKENIAQVYNNLSVISEHKGDLDKAQEYNLKSLQLFSESGNKRKTANVYLSLGYLENKRKNLETALDYFNKSYETMERIGNLYGAGTALMSKGRCYIDMGKLEESESTLLHSLRIHKELALKKKILANELALGKVFIGKGDNKPARTHLDAAKQIALKNGYTSDLARIASMEARLLINEGKKPDQKYREAIDLFKSIGRDREAASIEEELEVYAKKEGVNA